MATTRILIADDSLTIQKAFAMTFAGEDVSLLAARSADEGLTMARQARPELVIADGVMPGRSGYELCVAIKSDPALRGVPVYILASSQNPYDEARGLQSGADGQLTKPFESVALVAKVKEAIAKGTSNAITSAPAVVPGITPAPVLRPSLANSTSGLSSPARSAAPPVQAGPPSPMDDDYGEISIEDSGPSTSASPSASASEAASEITPPPLVPLVPPRPAMPMGTTTAALGGLRPSLIPGLRPGAAPAPAPARPGTSLPSRPAAAPGFTGHPGATGYPNSPPTAHGGAGTQMPSPTPSQVPALRAPYPQASSVGVGPARTLVGLPATMSQPAARFGAPAAPARPPTQPVRPLDGMLTPPPVNNAPLFPSSSPSAAAVSSKIDQKIAAIAARGPEYEAIAKLSREIIEKIVWEVVPELAEMIIREELQKRGRV